MVRAPPFFIGEIDCNRRTSPSCLVFVQSTSLFHNLDTEAGSYPDPSSSVCRLVPSFDSNRLRMTNTSSIPSGHSPETLLTRSHVDSPTLSQASLLLVVVSRVPTVLRRLLMSKFVECLAAVLSDVLLGFLIGRAEPLPYLVLCQQADLGSTGWSLLTAWARSHATENFPFVTSKTKRHCRDLCGLQFFDRVSRTFSSPSTIKPESCTAHRIGVQEYVKISFSLVKMVDRNDVFFLVAPAVNNGHPAEAVISNRKRRHVKITLSSRDRVGVAEKRHARVNLTRVTVVCGERHSCNCDCWSNSGAGEKSTCGRDSDPNRQGCMNLTHVMFCWWTSGAM